MKFRIKPDYYFGLDEKGEPIQKDVILEGCLNADLRKELLEKYESKAITKAEYDRERKARLKRSSRGFGKVLRPYVYLRHGDIVVMNGEDTQTYYEVWPFHQLAHFNLRRTSNSSSTVSNLSPVCGLQ